MESEIWRQLVVLGELVGDCEGKTVGFKVVGINVDGDDVGL